MTMMSMPQGKYLTQRIKDINTGVALGKRSQRDYKPAEIYCGDEDRAAFLVMALAELGLDAQCEIFTIDGEYHVEVK